MKQYVKEDIDQYKIIAIVRGIEKKYILDTTKALYEGGIRLLEITFNQKSPSCIEDTQMAIEMVKGEFGDRMRVGAGTVLTREQVDAAYNVGAEFILSAVMNKEIIQYANELGLVSIPGALTPTEIELAYSYGADYIKVFPAGDLGISYLKSIKAPLSHIPMTAVGGVGINNIRDFLAIGINVIGLGSNLVNPKLIKEGKFKEITDLARQFTQLISE